MPGGGSHGWALTARDEASSSQPSLLFMPHGVTRRARAGTRDQLRPVKQMPNPPRVTAGALTGGLRRSWRSRESAAPLSDEPKTDAIDRAGKATLPPLPSLRDELPLVQALDDRSEKRGRRNNARASALSDPFSGGAIC
jgi:hypothetical protein